jgi:hypothetical protein
MKRYSQLPLTFNNDKDVKRLRKIFSELSPRDIDLFENAVQYERASRKSNANPIDQIGTMAIFLDNLHFDYFCTFTTPYKLSLNSSRRISDQICNFVNAGRDSSVFWCAEKFKLTEGAGSNRYHLHALMKTDYDRFQILDWYRGRYSNGIAQLRPVDVKRGLSASFYVSKYITKELSDYDLRISPGHLRAEKKSILSVIAQVNASDFPQHRRLHAVLNAARNLK